MIKTAFVNQNHSFILITLTIILLVFTLQPNTKVEAGVFVSVAPEDAGLLQYTSQEHVLGFRSGEMYASNGTYALNVSFEGANAVTPTSDRATQDGQVPELGRVMYANLWDGITLAYQPSVGGIFESTYRVEPQSDVGAIRLRYNAPLTVNNDGTLTVTFEAGQVTESAPIAWQEVEGQRQPVEIAFAQLNDHEISFAIGIYDANKPLFIDPTFMWNTFLGGNGNDSGDSIAVDGSGNVYVAGYSTAGWGCSPTSCTIRAYRSNRDAFVAKLDSTGKLIWNTFLGDTGDDFPYGIAVDGSGMYVTGNSNATWGSPIRAYGGAADSFVAKLDLDGNLVWNTFLGGSGNDAGRVILVDTNGIYIAGESSAAWSCSPTSCTIRGYTASFDAFVAKLQLDGILTWNTFLGGSGDDRGYSMAVNGNKMYITGNSNATWGSPIRAYTNAADDFVAKLDLDGTLAWNTFLGGGGNDAGNSIMVDTDGIYIAGESSAAWSCSPTSCTIRGYTASFDAFVAKLQLDGILTWNTFLGGSGDDRGYSMAVNGNKMYITGKSNATWGSPIYAYTASYDAFIVRLNSSGNLFWNAFLGSNGIDIGRSIALDGNLIYLTGNSTATWGTPVRAYSSLQDTFVKKIYGLCTISGNVGVAGATLHYTDGTAKTATSLSNGAYSFTVSDYWSGTVTPSKARYSFLPSKKIYTNVIANKSAEDYSAYAPAGSILDTTPTYQWTKVTGATQYQYQLMQGVKIIYTKTVGSSVCKTVICSNTPATALGMGTFKWRVRANVGGAWKDYSPFITFSLKPKAGYWKETAKDTVEFYITANQISVNAFASYFTACGSPQPKIIYSGLIPIVNNQFSFTGRFYGDGTFVTPTSAKGTVGISNYSFPGCPNQTAGPYGWTATWIKAISGSDILDFPSIGLEPAPTLIIEPAP